jgi:hypothetical protein
MANLDLSRRDHDRRLRDADEERIMLNDITERLEERAVSYEKSGPSAHHTAALLREAKIEIETLRSALSTALLGSNP